MLPPEFFKDKDGGFSYCLRAENVPVAAFSQDVWQMGLVFYEMETRHCFTREKMTNRRDSWGASTAIQSFMQDRSRQLASIQDSPIRDAIDRSLVEAPELRASAKNIHEKLVQELTHAG